MHSIKSVFINPRLFLFTSILLLLISIVTATHRADDGFLYKQDYKISDVYNIDHADEPVLLTIDSQKLIADGKLKEDCSDFRVFDRTWEIQGINITGCGSNETKIYFPYTLSAGDSRVISIYYGCPSCDPPAQYSPGWKNIHLNSSDLTDAADVCWASSTYPDYSPSNIVDDEFRCEKENCRWAPANGYGASEWIVCDLGEEHVLAAARFINMGGLNDGWEGYNISVSEDNITWHDVAEGSNLPDVHDWFEDRFIPTEARYFRFKVYDSHWIYLDEVEFYGPLVLEAKKEGPEFRTDSSKMFIYLHNIFLTMSHLIATGMSPGAGLALGFGIFTGVIFIIMLFVAISIFLFIFWLLMLIDCVKRDFKSENDKIAWVLLLVFLGVLAAIIYYFVVKAKDKQGRSKR